MSVIQTCFDTKDVLDLFRPQGLHLKPLSRLNVSVQLPQLKKSGAKISNWEVMERIKEMAKPFAFPVFKVAKSSLEFIRFEAEIENYGSMEQVLAKLDMKTIKLSGFHELLKVRAAETKTPFPTRQEWDSYFVENKAMNEMKAGERPDTIHLQNLPTKWFVNRQDKSGVAKDVPSEFVLKKVFAAFGEIRAVDIPMLDPYREKMKSSISGIQTFTFGQDLVFEAYIQYKEYIGFVKAMNSLKGMKLLYKDRYEERSWVANIKVDFDKTKHLADSTIKKRSQERERLVQKEREKDEAERRKAELEELKRSDELRKLEAEERELEKKRLAERRVKDTRREEREKKRREQKLKKKFANDDEELAHRIAEEERKLLVAQRKLESIRLLDELLERVKALKSKGSLKSIEADLLKTAAKEAKVGKAASMLTTAFKEKDEKRLRDKLVSKLKQKEVQKMEHFGQRLQDVRDGNTSLFLGSEVEDISDDDFEDQSEVDSLDEVSEENSNDELKLTTSTDEEEFEEKRKSKLKKKKSKKEKKKRKKEKKEKKRADKESRKKKDLESQISLAQRIAEGERRSRSIEDRREKTRDRSHRSRSGQSGRRSLSGDEGGYPDYLARRAEERSRRRQLAQQEAKKKETAKEEIYDRMMNPHLYGADGGGGGGGGYRRVNRGEHYEDVQKRELDEHIREKEREERFRLRERERRRRYEDERQFHPYQRGGHARQQHYEYRDYRR